MEFEQIKQAFLDFIANDGYGVDSLHAACNNYAFAPLAENCCVGFDLDPRFDQLTKFRHAEQISGRCAEIATSLYNVARTCVARGKSDKAKAALQMALDFLTEANLGDSEEYKNVKKQLDAIA